MTINRAPRVCCGIPKYTSQFLQSKLVDLSCSWKQNQIDNKMRSTMSTFNTRSGQNSHLKHPRTISNDNSRRREPPVNDVRDIPLIPFQPYDTAQFPQCHHNIIYRHSPGPGAFVVEMIPHLLCRSGLQQIWLYKVRINHQMNNNGIIINGEWRAWNSGIDPTNGFGA